jgi:hypothetical protein
MYPLTFPAKRIGHFRRSDWMITLEEDKAIFVQPKKNEQFEIPRDKARREITLLSSFLSGYNVSVHGNKKSNRFSLKKENVEYLKKWLPPRTQLDVEYEVRKISKSLLALAIIHLIVPFVLLRSWGLVLLVASAVGWFYPVKKMFLVIAVLNLIAGVINIMSGNSFFFVLAFYQFFLAFRELSRFSEKEVGGV